MVCAIHPSHYKAQKVIRIVNRVVSQVELLSHGLLRTMELGKCRGFRLFSLLVLKLMGSPGYNAPEK